MGRESGGSQEQHANVSRPQGEARAAFSLHVSDFFTARAVLLCVVHAHANGGPGEAPDLEPETPEEPRVSRREEGGSLLGRALGSAASGHPLSFLTTTSGFWMPDDAGVKEAPLRGEAPSSSKPHVTRTPSRYS